MKNHYIFVMALFFSCAAHANASNLQLTGFPSAFQVQLLFSSQQTAGRESTTYRFHGAVDEAQSKYLVHEWMSGFVTKIGAHHSSMQARSTSEWHYLSGRRDGWWVIAQWRAVRAETQASASAQTEGLVTLWRDAEQRSAVKQSLGGELSLLVGKKAIADTSSRDRGHTVRTVTYLLSHSVPAVIASMQSDLSRGGFRRDNALRRVPQTKDENFVEPSYAGQFWRRAAQRVVFTVFEHRGATALVIHEVAGGTDD